MSHGTIHSQLNEVGGKHCHRHYGKTKALLTAPAEIRLKTFEVLENFFFTRAKNSHLFILKHFLNSFYF
jgi:hypothetical protein